MFMGSGIIFSRAVLRNVDSHGSRGGSLKPRCDLVHPPPTHPHPRRLKAAWELLAPGVGSGGGWGW